MQVLRLNTDSSVEIIEINNTDFDALAKLIDCDWIQIVRPRNSKYVLVVDEEGKLKENSINPHASVMYGYLKHKEPIVGKALLMREVLTENGYELTGLEDAKEIKDILDDLNVQLLVKE